jgi:hypothetical protein
MVRRCRRTRRTAICLGLTLVFMAGGAAAEPLIATIQGTAPIGQMSTAAVERALRAAPRPRRHGRSGDALTRRASCWSGRRQRDRHDTRCYGDGGGKPERGRGRAPRRLGHSRPRDARGSGALALQTRVTGRGRALARADAKT